MSDSTLALCQQYANIGDIPKRKRGRPPMPYGNRDRSKQKGLHLPAVTHEMLAQLVVVRGGSESHHANIAIQEYFRTVYTDITQAYGKRYWQKRLEEGHLADKLKLE